MSSENIIEVMEVLIGRVNPRGETNIDNERFDNQEKMIDCVDHMINQLSENAVLRNNSAHSISIAGERAFGFLKNLHDSLEDIEGIGGSKQESSI